VAQNILDITKALSDRVEAMAFGEPVTHVYNPLVYGWAAHADYLDRYGQGTGRVIWLGMNPGPFGMAQTAVPFGEIAHVRDWMGIRNVDQKPPDEHPKRPVLGFECTRSEVSGRRLWSWAKAHYGTADAFFTDNFVVNYCPLVFMEGKNGRNRTPDKLPSAEREPLYEACSEALAQMVDLLQPKMVLGVGNFAEKRARDVVGGRVAIGRVLHPSPASPAANRGWAQAAEKQLTALGLLGP
jgi:single-strand selective monofunctional uracil DNA glycosylase